MRWITFTLLVLLVSTSCAHVNPLAIGGNEKPVPLCSTPTIVVISDELLKEVSWWKPIVLALGYWEDKVEVNLFFIALNAKLYSPSKAIVFDISPDGDGGTTALDAAQISELKCVSGAKILLSTLALEKLGAFRLETLVRHEVGHVLGLDHIAVWSDDVMWGEVIEDNITWPHPRPAHRDEIELVKQLYKDKK